MTCTITTSEVPDISKTGRYYPDSILQEWRNLDALYLGAVGTPDVPPGVIERGLLLKMRFELDLYINLRPFVKEATEDSEAHNFTVIREKHRRNLRWGGWFFKKRHQP